MHQDDENSNSILQRTRPEDSESEVERTGVTMDVGILGRVHIDPPMSLVDGTISELRRVVEGVSRGLGVTAERGPPQRVGGPVFV